MRSTHKVITSEEMVALLRSSARLSGPERRPGRLRDAAARLLHTLADRITGAKG